MDDGPMYGGSFQDLDGHVWELIHMSQPVGSSLFKQVTGI